MSLLPAGKEPGREEADLPPRGLYASCSIHL
uniref:Uncharacterized protein n=1 Tax=Myoviridae sp. ctFNi10 TaxID=2825067 RepID=A0A8S5TX35_9CAUD|nr:MAG TPA: hypothetical protein [Myoviridae sp. ctFNi10]